MTTCLASIKTCADLWAPAYSTYSVCNSAAVSAQHVMPCLLLSQVWRPLKGPINESPLGTIDDSAADMKDLMRIIRHSSGRTGYACAVKHNVKHK